MICLTKKIAVFRALTHAGRLPLRPGQAHCRPGISHTDTLAFAQWCGDRHVKPLRRPRAQQKPTGGGAVGLQGRGTDLPFVLLLANPDGFYA